MFLLYHCMLADSETTNALIWRNQRRRQNRKSIVRRNRRTNSPSVQVGVGRKIDFEVGSWQNRAMVVLYQPNSTMEPWKAMGCTPEGYKNWTVLAVALTASVTVLLLDCAQASATEFTKASRPANGNECIAQKGVWYERIDVCPDATNHAAALLAAT